MVYGHSVHLIAGSELSKLVTRINSLQKVGGERNLPYALSHFKKGVLGKEGLARKASHLLVFIQNGMLSRSYVQDSKALLDEFRTDGVKIIGVGVGEEIRKDLDVMTTKPQDKVIIIQTLKDIYQIIPIASRVLSTFPGGTFLLFVFVICYLFMSALFFIMLSIIQTSKGSIQKAL